MAEGVLKRLKKDLLSNDIGVDLGTATILICVKDRGIVLCEPSVVVVEKETGNVVCVGNEAMKRMNGLPANCELVRPLRQGVIHQYSVAMQMVTYLIKRACGSMLMKPRMIICIPTGATEVEECAVKDAAAQAGARQIFLIEEPVAAAIGAGFGMTDPKGRMIVDIGGGTTDIAVLSMGEVVVSESIKIAGDNFDAALMAYMRHKYNMVIGEMTAEKIKRTIGNVDDSLPEKFLQVNGRGIQTGVPQTVTISSREMFGAFTEPITAILDAIYSVIARTPPELVGDLSETGIVLTGGGSLMAGLDRLITRAIHLRTVVAPNAHRCVALGIEKKLGEISTLPDGILNLSRERANRY